MGVTGGAAVNRMLEQKFAAIERAIRNEIRRTGDMVRRDADSNAASLGIMVDGAYLRIAGNVHGASFEAGNGYRIWVDGGKYAAYLEFGTGAYAERTVGKYDMKWQELAFEFYVNGKGHLPARPYLYPAWVQNTTGMVDRMRSKLRAI